MTVPVGSVPVEGVGSNTVSNPGTISVGTTSTTALASNSSRREAVIQNTDVTIIYLGFSSTPTTTTYQVALKACTVANDGTGGIFITDMFTGAINAIGSAAGGHISVFEFS